MSDDYHGHGRDGNDRPPRKRQDRRPYSKDGGRGSDGGRPSRSDRGGDRPRRDGRSGDRQYRPRDRDSRPRSNYRPRDDDGGERDYHRDRPPRSDDRRGNGHHDRDSRSDRRPRMDEGGRPPRNRDGDDRPRRDSRPRYEDRPPRRDGDGKGYRDRPRRDDQNRGGRRDSSRSGYGDRGSRDRDSRPRRYEDRPPRDEQSPERIDKPQEQKLTVPSTPERILFKGIDCEVNGRNDLAIALYLHGAMMDSGGCESNALRMLRDMGKGEFGSARGRVAKSCPEDALVVFDYLCYTLDRNYDRAFLDAQAASGNNLAISYLIRLEEVDGEDGMVDAFASGISEHESRVEEGLKYLVRKKDSAKAAEYLRRNEERKKLRQSIRGTFVKAMKGDPESIGRLGKLSEEFPEAGYLEGYVGAYADGSAEQYLKDGMPEHKDTILSMVPELRIGDTAFGKYLHAKRLQINEEEWIQPMIAAVKEGSEEALVELGPVQNRKDVRKSLASYYLEKGDVEALVRSYDGEDSHYLEEYCADDPQRFLEVGRILGGVKEIDWLKKGFLLGHPECTEALIAMVDDESRRCKQLVYTLHDVGADLESAKLYFMMGDDPTLPAVKWLKKTCSNDEAKEFVRSQFEARGDPETFESIFVDDGYVTRHSKGGRPSGGRGKGGYKGRR